MTTVCRVYDSYAQARAAVDAVERASVPAADMTRFLERFDLKLIAEKVDDEASLSRLIEYGADLAEGDLFGSPRPVTPEMFRELSDADAA